MYRNVGPFEYQNLTFFFPVPFIDITSILFQHFPESCGLCKTSSNMILVKLWKS